MQHLKLSKQICSTESRAIEIYLRAYCEGDQSQKTKSWDSMVPRKHEELLK